MTSMTPHEAGKRRSARGLLIAGLVGLSACTAASRPSPSVAVADVELTGIGLLQQDVLLTLCVTNPGPAALDFSRISFTLDVSGTRLADGRSEAPIRLPPSASILVPIAVTTTDRDLGRQILETLLTGSIAYRLHGAATLAAFPVPIPFNRNGNLSVLDASSRIAAIDPTRTRTACGIPPGRPPT